MFYEFLAEEAKKDGVEKLVVGAVITNDKGEVFIAKRKPNDFMGGIYEILINLTIHQIVAKNQGSLILK